MMAKAIPILITLIISISCSRNISTNRGSVFYEISYEVLPETKYTLRQTFWSKRVEKNYTTTEIKDTYDFEIDSQHLNHIVVRTIDTIFYYSHYMDGRRFKSSKKYPFSMKSGETPTNCHSKDGKQIFFNSSDSLSKYTYNQYAIQAWNAQEFLPNCRMQIGQNVELSRQEYSYDIHQHPYDPKLIKTNYCLDSVDNNIAFIHFNASVFNNDSMQLLIAKEYGNLEFEMKEKYFKKIKRYRVAIKTNDNNEDQFQIWTKDSDFPASNIVEISINR